MKKWIFLGIVLLALDIMGIVYIFTVALPGNAAMEPSTEKKL